MRIFNQFRIILIIAARRILSQPWMALANMLGMIFTISLTMSVPFYASSVYNRIFLQEVGVDKNQESANSSTQPPFSFVFTYDSNIYGNLQLQDVEPLDTFLEVHTSSAIQLPIKQYVHYYATNPLALFPTSPQKFAEDQKPLMWSSISTFSRLQDHLTILEGNFPQSGVDGPIQVLISETTALNLGIQVGETYNLLARDQIVNGSRTTVSIPVEIAGVYTAADPESDYWFIRPYLLKDSLLVPDDIFKNQVGPALTDEIYGAFWYVLADGASVKPDSAMDLATRIQSYQRQVEQVLPKARLSVSPVDALYNYQRAANLLTVLLFAFSVPIFGLLLAFIVMTSGMIVERQRNEIAVMRSRGAMIVQMIGIAIVESLLLGLIALVISLPASAAIAYAISHTRSFLDFSGTVGGSSASMFNNFSSNTLLFGLGAIILTVATRLIPTFRAAGDTIVVYKRERARTLRLPLWQRMGLDFFLMIPAGYGIYLLRQEGSIDAFGASAKGDPFSNPLLIMVPALTIFALSLFFLRLLPYVMSAITWVTARTRSVGLMMAARHLARTPGNYNLPLILLILTLSLSAFTATLAGTLDNHLHDQVYYQIGSDATFVDLGDSPSSATAGIPSQPAPQTGNSGDTPTATQPGWLFLPITDYLSLPGVTNVTRVGNYAATFLLGGRDEPGRILGIDRYNLPKIAFWRTDFASISLGELMNRLALTPDGILLPEDFMTSHTLSINDLVTLQLSNYQNTTEMDFHIVGNYKLFPTYYPGEEPVVIANLDYIFQEVGGEFPYDVWLKTNAPPNIEALNNLAFMNIGARTLDWKEPSSIIAKEQSRPERQGLFGVLSVGFGAAALLTVLGFLMYAQLSYQRRFVELGVLRAVGLSTGQMTSFLAAELAFLIFSGGFIGTALGVWISNLFIPYLQIGGSDYSTRIPPYVVHIAWPAIFRVYALFGILFVVALVGLIILLRRMRIFQVIKMGESL